jgi:glycerate dehydrogenase
MKGVVLDLGSVDNGDIDFSRVERILPQWTFHAETAPGQVAERIAGCAVVVSNKVMLDADSLAQSPDLKLICVAATGTNNVDLDAARAQGITVSNVRGYATPSVVEHVFGLILTLARRLDAYRAAAADGRWAASPHFCLLDFPMLELHGKVLGVVGYGELGHGVAELGRALGMTVRIAERRGATKPREGRAPFDQVLAAADVLTLHCPLSDETRNLIGAAELARMKPGALLINAARGGVVDEAALADALRSGHLGGAGVDVLTEEPPRHGNPLLAPDIPNLIVTPHIAWASRESRQRLVNQVAENISSFLGGTPRNVVG